MRRLQNSEKYPTFFRNYLVTSKQSGIFFQIFVAFSKYLNFTYGFDSYYSALPVACLKLCVLFISMESFSSAKHPSPPQGNLYVTLNRRCVLKSQCTISTHLVVFIRMRSFSLAFRDSLKIKTTTKRHPKQTS